MQSPVHRPSRKDLGFLPLPRLDSNGWQTPTGASTAASSPWDDGTHNPYAEISPVTTRPQPLRLSLLQHRMDGASSTSANAPESPRPLSPLSPRYSRPEGSALGIIVPPGTPPADALPRWLVDRQFSRPRPRLAGNRTPSKGPDTHSPFETAFSSASPAIHDWHNEFRPLVRTPEELTPFQGPSGSSHDSFPFDLGAISGERINTPVGPRVRPRPLPRCSSDDIADNRLFRVNAWGEHRSPLEASGGLFALMQGHGHGEPRARPRHLPPSRLVSTAPSPMPSPPG